jgi:hypothetical protein
VNLNPELRRNLWLQLTPQRLVAAPLVLGTVFAAVWLVFHDSDMVRTAATWAFYLIAVLWGTKRAAESVAEEVSGGTWDGQRMSALGAWTMSWGKLVGGTSFIWYAAVICLLVREATPTLPTLLSVLMRDAVLLVGSALIGQAVAFAASLMFLRRAPAARRLPVTLSQILGLLAAIAGPGGFHWLNPVWREDSSLVNWWGWSIAADDLTLASLWIFTAWAAICGYRLMRAELQFRSWPWVWLSFAVFLMVYVEGFLSDRLRQLDLGRPSWWLAPLAVAVVLTYAGLFAEGKDIVRYRWFAAALRGGALSRALGLVPLWLPAFALAILAAGLGQGGTGLGAWHPLLGTFLPDVTLTPSTSALIALPLFMLRDIALVLYLNFGGRSQRADLGAFVYLWVLYVPLPGIAYSLGLVTLPSVFLPVDTGGALSTILPPLLEAAAMLALLRRRWRVATRGALPVGQAVPRQMD